MFKFVEYVLIFLVLYRVFQIVNRLYFSTAEKQRNRMTIRQEEKPSASPSSGDGEYIDYEEVK
jgi:hypothetical protein